MGTIVGLTFDVPESAPEVYTCPICGKEYKTEEGLDKHIQDKHPEE